MSRIKSRIPIVAILAALALGFGQAVLAQMAPTGPPAPVFKGPGIQGKMNSTTKAERIAAAIRNANRRAATLRANQGKKGK